MSGLGLVASALRPGHPTFLDLPWELPLEAWVDRCERLVEVPAGASRHVVLFVCYEHVVYAMKELPVGRAVAEYELLRKMAELDLPCVEAIGHVETVTAEGGASVLVTRYLERSLPYQVLFQENRLAHYREHLLDALASLLVELHLAGVWWGDCSLFNALFRRDAGTLQAYLVDAETSEVQSSLSDAMRRADLDLAEENVAGALLDLAALGTLPPGLDVAATSRYLRTRYDALWAEVSRVEVVPAEADAGSFGIQERVRSLNALGFSVAEVELRPGPSPRHPAARRLHMRAVVTDLHFHRTLLSNLVGLELEERQARLVMNEINERKALLSREQNRSLPTSVAAFSWLRELYEPITAKLRAAFPDADATELYCELLTHKWYLSEKAQRDIGHEAALTDLLARQSPTPS